MNNIVNMVNYYILHKNADDSIIEYLKRKIDSSSVDELIIIQIKLLFTDPSDKLVSLLVNYINDKINEILKEVDLYDIASLISQLKDKKGDIIKINKDLEIKNQEIFAKIKTKDLNYDGIFDNEDSKVAASLINEIENNNFEISRNKSEINSIEIWLLNLENSFNKRLSSESLENLLNSYIKELTLLNRDDYINTYINKTNKKIEEYILQSNLLDTIINVIPELDRLYDINSSNKNELYKLLDYYIDLVEINIKNKINRLNYEERLLLKEKIDIICDEILSNNDPSDDFKVQVIKNYIKYI